MNNVYKLYKENYEKLTKTEKKIAEYISKNPKKVIVLSALELGKEIGVSDASILRFSKNIGFNKFNDFKNYIAMELSEANLNERIVKNWDNFKSENDIVDKIINADLKNIEEFLKEINFKYIEKMVEFIEKAERVYFLGLGPSRAISQFMHWHTRRLGYSSECINEGSLNLYETLTNIKNSELLVVFAFPKFLNDEFNAIKIAKERNAKIILITSNIFSEISFLSDIVFKLAVQNNGFLNSYMVPMEFCNIVLTILFERNKKEIYERWKKESSVKNCLFVLEN